MTASQRMFGSLWNVVVAHERRRQDGGRWVCTMADGEMPDSDRWMSVATFKPTRWQVASVADGAPALCGLNVEYQWFISPSKMLKNTESCSSPGDTKLMPETMFYSHFQTMTGQPAVAGSAGSSHFDRPQRRESTVTAGHFLLVVFGTKPLSLTVSDSEIFNGECYAMIDMTLNDL